MIKYTNRLDIPISVGIYSFQPQSTLYFDTDVLELDRVEGVLVDKYVNGYPHNTQVKAEFNYYQPVLSPTKGDGIKLDVQSPQYGWHDLLSPTIIYEGAASNKPNFNTLVGGIRKYQFAVGDESFHEFHIPHDYAPGTDLYIHVHWTHNSGTVTGGNTVWNIEATYSKGYSQQVFSTTKNLTITQAVVTAPLTHQIAETKFSISGGSATQLNSLDIETDGLILVRTSLQSNTTGTDPFMLFCDVHYQTTNLGTLNRNFNFWN